MNIIICKTCGYFKGWFGEIQNCPVCNNSIEYVTTISESEYMAMTNAESEQFAINYVGHDFDPELKLKRIEYDANKRASIRKYTEEFNAKHPECPTCHSTNTQSISGLERGISVVGLGIFSKKINKSFKCKNCGYTW